MLKETKRRLNSPKLKAKNLLNYQLFELRWETKEEGGKGLCRGPCSMGPAGTTPSTSETGR